MTVIPATFGRAPFPHQLKASVEMLPLVDALIRAHWASEGWGDPPEEQMPVLRRAAQRTAETALGMMTVRHQCALTAAQSTAEQAFADVDGTDREAVREFGWRVVDAYLQTVRPL